MVCREKTKVSADYADDIWKSFQRDVFPAIGQMHVTELKAYTLVNALEPVLVRGAKMR
ncbi:hypothetical protein M3B74_11050 [Citrobacter freundii]|uniref:phage integrase central domain-containing protein n=1 Tax=Citrobacter freundii TaxID=546 RepID=UPI001F50BA35|nr:hypothetical protein [Citrobacter freundii]MCT1466441.1 hypothetical protein [Citrobacter freundii]MCT1495559.1 hypothetical protein [Citrobacter freundii]